MSEDIVYAILLLLGIGFGHFYRRIRDKKTKKLVGSCFGVVIVLFCSGLSSLHLFLSFLICWAIIKFYEA